MLQKTGKKLNVLEMEDSKPIQESSMEEALEIGITNQHLKTNFMRF